MLTFRAYYFSGENSRKDLAYSITNSLCWEKQNVFISVVAVVYNIASMKMTV